MEQAAHIKVTDIGAGTDQGRCGNRGVDAAKPSEVGDREIDARTGFNHSAEIERVRQLRRAAGACRCATACAGAANEAGAVWMIVLDTSIIAAMQAGYIGGSALFVAVAD